MTTLFPLASWSAADEATRMWLQAHLFHDVLWHMPGRDELGQTNGDVHARIVGVNVRDKVVVFRSLDARDHACFGWSFKEAAFEWIEGRLVVEPARCDALCDTPAFRALAAAALEAVEEIYS